VLAWLALHRRFQKTLLFGSVMHNFDTVYSLKAV
jgi:hypothetical protein